MISTDKLAAVVALAGLTACAGALVGQVWDLLTAWLIWGSVMLAALICQLPTNYAHRFHRAPKPHPDSC